MSIKSNSRKQYKHKHVGVASTDNNVDIKHEQQRIEPIIRQVIARLQRLAISKHHNKPAADDDEQYGQCDIRGRSHGDRDRQITIHSSSSSSRLFYHI